MRNKLIASKGLLTIMSIIAFAFTSKFAEAEDASKVEVGQLVFWDAKAGSNIAPGALAKIATSRVAELATFIVTTLTVAQRYLMLTSTRPAKNAGFVVNATGQKVTMFVVFAMALTMLVLRTYVFSNSVWFKEAKKVEKAPAPDPAVQART